MDQNEIETAVPPSPAPALRVLHRGEDRPHVITEKLRRVFRRPCKRILLINPPSIAGEYYNLELAQRKRYFAYPPYGLGVLSAHLKQHNYDPHILDLNLKVLGIVDGLRPDDVFDLEQLVHTLVVTALNDTCPDVVGVTSMFTMSHEIMLNITETVKSQVPEMPVVVGGVHPTNAPEMILRQTSTIDFIAMHESEVMFIDLLEFVNRRRQDFEPYQISTLIDNAYIEAELGSPPESSELNVSPDYLDLPVDQYSELGEVGAYRFMHAKGSRASTALSNRGCRAKCTFCSVRNFNGLGVRSRTVESVVDEIEGLHERYGIDHIMWLDDDLFYARERAVRLFNTIRERQLNLTWDASNGVIASAVTEELIDAAAQSGCNGMHVGVESGSSEILKEIKKPSGVRHYEKAGEILARYPTIFTKGFLIIGFPNETLRQIQETISLARRMCLDWYTISNLTPLPSTEIYDQMVRQGLMEEGITDFKKVNYGSAQTGKQQDKENREQHSARDFVDHFSGELDVVPTPEDLDDIWLHMDYKINYDPLLSDDYPSERLPKLKLFLDDVSKRMTAGNPVPKLFLGVIEEKLSNPVSATRYYEDAARDVERSRYWKVRFDVLGLNQYIP